MRRMPRAPALRDLAARVGVILALGTGLASTLGYAAWLLPGLWALDLFGHFRVHYAIALAIAALLLAIGRRRGWLVAALLLLVADLGPLAPLWFGRAGAAAGPSLRLVHFNVLSSNRAQAEVATWLASSGADLIFVQEVDPTWAVTLARIPGYQMARSLPRRDNFGIALLVRDGAPVTSTGVIELAEGIPALRADVLLAERSLPILAVHTLPPVSGEYAATRDRQLEAAGAWAIARRGEGAAPVVIGDLNATPWSASLRAMIRDAALIDSQQGHGLQASWPAMVPAILRIPIDHCLHDPRLWATARRLGPDLGSDHLPLIVDLAWASPG